MNTQDLEDDLRELSAVLNKLVDSYPLTVGYKSPFRDAMNGTTFDTDEAVYELKYEQMQLPNNRGVSYTPCWHVTKEFKVRKVNLT